MALPLSLTGRNTGHRRNKLPHLSFFYAFRHVEALLRCDTRGEIAKAISAMGSGGGLRRFGANLWREKSCIDKIFLSFRGCKH